MSILLGNQGAFNSRIFLKRRTKHLHRIRFRTLSVIAIGQ